MGNLSKEHIYRNRSIMCNYCGKRFRALFWKIKLYFVQKQIDKGRW